AGFLGRKFDPLLMAYGGGYLNQGKGAAPGVLPAAFRLPGDVSKDRLAGRVGLLRSVGSQAVGRGTKPAKEWNAYQAQAVDVLRSGKAWKAFSIEDEKPATCARYGDDQLGRSCLVARRLVEAGVALVTVVFGGWDTHSHHLEHTRDRLLPPLDRAFAALVE